MPLISISEAVARNTEKYLQDCGEHAPTGLYDAVLGMMERPLLVTLFEHTKGNQSTMAHILGINRNTLRKKLLQYKLIASN